MVQVLKMWTWVWLAYTVGLTDRSSMFLEPAHPSKPGQRAVRPVCCLWALSLQFNGYFFQVDPGQQVPKCLHSVFIRAKADWNGGNSLKYNTSKAPLKLSPPTNQRSTFSQAGCPSCRPSNNVKAPRRYCCLWELRSEKCKPHHFQSINKISLSC